MPATRVGHPAKDLIYTGTPAGVGAILPGDEMIGGVDGIGEIRVPVVWRRCFVNEMKQLLLSICKTGKINFIMLFSGNAANVPKNNSVLAEKCTFPRGFPAVDFNCSDSVSAKYKKLKIL